MAAPDEDVISPFGDDIPSHPVKPTYFDPCEGYQPRKRFVRRSDGRPMRVDDIPEKEQTVTTTAIAERRPTDTVATWPKQQIDLVRRTVAVGATDDELALYLYDCERRGIHPLDKLLHFTKRGGKYTPVTSIDFMRAQAAMSGEMAGSDDPVYTEKDGKLVSATVVVYRMTQNQRFPYTATARWSEYCPDNAPMWRRMPHTMLGKCAEALALRKAFPQQLAGLYSSEEMDQSDGASRPVVRAPGSVDGGLTTSRSPEVTVVTPRQSVGDSGVGRSGPKSPVGADLSTGSNSDEGPDLGAADIELPEGFHLIDNYHLDGDWHQVTWGRDAQGGSMTLKTKLATIGLQAHNAFTEQMPVRLHFKKYPYLDKVEKLGSTIPQIRASKFNPDDDRFCDECGRPAKECLC